MSKAVADTNTVVSRLLSPQSTPAQALEHLGATHTVIGSTETIEELYDVIRRDKFARIPLARREQFLIDFIGALTVIDITAHITACRHPKDDKFLSLAVSGNAALILTGDNDLLTLHPFRGIGILSPRTYLETQA